MANCPDHDIEVTAAYRLGALEEQSRIISLLEAIDEYPRGWDHNDPIQSVITIIKGTSQ